MTLIYPLKKFCISGQTLESISLQCEYKPLFLDVLSLCAVKHSTSEEHTEPGWWCPRSGWNQQDVGQQSTSARQSLWDPGFFHVPFSPLSVVQMKGFSVQNPL